MTKHVIDIIDTVWYSVANITHISNCYRIYVITITLFTHSRLTTSFSYKSNAMDVTSVARNTYHSRATWSNLGFREILVAQSLAFCVVLCG